MTSFTNTTRNYPTGADTAIRRVRQTRNPTTTDNHNFVLGDEWLNTNTQRWWKLTNITATTAKWVPWSANSTGPIDTITGDTGGAVPPTLSTANLNLLGTAGHITVTGNIATNTLTISQPNGIPASSFAPDTGTNPVVPTAGGLVNVKGQSTPNVSGIRVTGALNELDIAMFSPFVGDFTFTSPTSGDTETLTVSSTSNTASSQAQINTVVAGTTAGDAWNQWTLGSTRSYSWGIDTSTTNRIFKLSTAASATVNPSTGSWLEIDPVAMSSSFVQGDVSAISSQPGDSLIFFVNNTSGAADSGAGFFAAVPVGTGNTDPTMLYAIDAAGQRFIHGIDQSDSSKWKLSASATLGSNDSIVVTPAGQVTEPQQAAFFAYLASTVNNKTGNGTTYTLGTDALTEVYDQSNSFNTNGTFTAPVTGIYDLTAQISIQGCTVATTFAISIVVAGTSARTYQRVVDRAASNLNQSINISALAKMTAADTATVTIIATGEAGDTDDITGSATAVTFFCGTLAC